MQDTIQNELINNFSEQINEFDLLKSMYEQEIIVGDHNILDGIRKFVEGASDIPKGHLNFSVNLLTNKYKIELCVELPSFYPDTEKPEVCVRCNGLNRLEETNINIELANFVKENFEQQPFIYSIVSWLQEKMSDFESLKTTNECTIIKKKDADSDIKFSRYWIYSHHIYNKRKRNAIVNTAKDLKLTGFCLPGKPGVICVEGEDESCSQWWKYIRSMCWQKITLRKHEELSSVDHRKFHNFSEIELHSAARLGKHADMSEFSQYLENHDLKYIFKDLFGVSSTE